MLYFTNFTDFTDFTNFTNFTNLTNLTNFTNFTNLTNYLILVRDKCLICHRGSHVSNIMLKRR